MHRICARLAGHGAVVAAAWGLGSTLAAPARAAPSGVGITLRAAASAGEARESSLWVVVDGPLLPRSRARAAERAGLATPLDKEEIDTTTAPDSTSPAPAAVSERPAAEPEPPFTVPVLAPALVRDTVAAARRAAATRRARERLEATTRRSRRAAALPQVQARGGRTTDESLKLSPTADDPYRFTESGGTRLVGEVRLRWELDRLAFDPAELRLLALEQARVRAEADLVRQVLALLFAWHRGRVRAADPSLEPDARVDGALDSMEAALTLDVLTGGWFATRADALGPLGR